VASGLLGPAISCPVGARIAIYLRISRFPAVGNFNALGGAENITINDLTGTDVTQVNQPVELLHKTVRVVDLDIVYREAGLKDVPSVLLLHGFPTSSQMFRKLIAALGLRGFYPAVRLGDKLIASPFPSRRVALEEARDLDRAARQVRGALLRRLATVVDEA
jgi:hypothetical protein